MATVERDPTAEPPDPNEPNESSYMLRDKRSPHRRYRTTVLDDDWGWYVVSGCAFANFLLPGMLRNFGPDVIDGFVEINDIKSENGLVSHWIPATYDTMFYVAGSLSCLLCDLASHRTVTFWGGLLAFVGMMSSSFANSITYLYISYGLMVGFGAGLCCPAGMLIVNEYFDSHRGLANGLSLVGTTVGSLAMPPYIEFLTSSYGYRGGILIVSGMMLNLLACAVVYKPVDERVRFVEISPPPPSLSWSSFSSTMSINATRVSTSPAIRTAVDQFYVAVAQSSSAEPTTDNDHADPDRERLLATVRGQGVCSRLLGDKSAAEFLTVVAINAIGHLAYAAFVEPSTAPTDSATVALQLATADAAGRIFVPALSDLLSSDGLASVYLYALVTAIGGAALLAAAPSQTLSAVLLVAFGWASGAAVGLEPLVAVRVLGRQRLSTWCAAALLGKGIAQLAVDVLFSRGRRHRERRWHAPEAVVLYAVGSCLMLASIVWTAVLLFKRHYVTNSGCSQYVRTA